MSTKTIRKRIAVVAVSALTAGLFSVVSAPVANAATGDVSSAGNGASANVSNAVCTSYGLVTNPTLTVAANTATGVMYDSGTLALLMDHTAATGTIITVSGGTITSFDANGTGAALTGLTTIGAIGASANDYCFLVKPDAAGTPLVITARTGNAAADAVGASTVRDTIVMTVSAASAVNAFSASKSNIALTAAGLAPGTANIDTAGANVRENAACAYLYYELKDANGTQLTSASSVIAKVSSGFTVGIGAAGTIGVATGNYGAVATYLQACQATANTAATGTITLTVNGVDVATRTITIVGQLASITVVENAIAKRNDAGTTVAVYGDFTTRNAGTWYPSHSYTGKDAAGNLVPVDAAIDTTTLDAQVTALGDDGTADPRNADSDLRTGGLTFACANTSGSNEKLKLKVTAANGITSISSNAFKVTCAGDAVNYSASTDKAAYNTGDLITVTIKGTDVSGKTANDFGTISTTAAPGVIASGAIASTVAGPANLDTLTAGVKTYRYIASQTAGNYTISVDFPKLNSATYNQAALTIPVTVKTATTDVTNAEVLKSIVALIASINKQIAALQKLILRR